MITTRWIKINEYLEFRYKGPKWIVFILAKTNASGKEITPILGRIFQIICKVGGAKLQFRRRLPDIISDTETIMRMISPIYKDMD